MMPVQEHGRADRLSVLLIRTFPVRGSNIFGQLWPGPLIHGTGADQEASFWTLTDQTLSDNSEYKLLGDSVCGQRTSCQNVIMVKDISNEQNILRMVSF